MLDTYDSSVQWSRELNALGIWTGANSFVNGNGTVDGGTLMLAYADDGWFGSDVKTDVSRYTYLVLRLHGSAGGEEQHFRLSLGGQERVFAAYTLAGGGHPVIGMSFKDIRIPMAANGIDSKTPGQLAMSFWWGGSGTLSVDEIRFE